MARNAQYSSAPTGSPPGSGNNESASAAPKVQGDAIDAQFVPFRYAPLDSTRKQIRVLKLCGAMDGIIRCKLQTAEIGCDNRSKIPFRALSYNYNIPLLFNKHLVFYTFFY